MSALKLYWKVIFALQMITSITCLDTHNRTIYNVNVSTTVILDEEVTNNNDSRISTTEKPAIVVTTTPSSHKPSVISDTKIKLILDEHRGQERRSPMCKKESSCEPLHSNKCFGIVLPYKETSMGLIGNQMNQTEAQRQLKLWQGLRSVPRCWSVIQPLLCAIYMPKCENGSVELPSQELCRVTRGPCRIVEMMDGWPSFLKCESDHFSHQCKNEWREIKFNSTSRCLPPLIETDHTLSWIDGVEGCGIPCRNPLITEAEDHNLRSFTVIVGSICLSCCLFVVITFIIDWKSANKYPALMIFYINFCFFIASIGWMAQFTPGAREDIVCRKDGTLRLREPSSGENLSCVIIFIMIYYFVMAAIIWFVVLTFSWYMSFRDLGKIRDSVAAKTAYFHLAAWSLPLILTITILALGQIDGDSESGICFVGSLNMYVRVGFVLVPVIIGASIGGFFLAKSLQILLRLKIGSSDIINEKAHAKINKTIFRIAISLVFIIFLALTTLVCHIYEFLHRAAWQKSFRDYLVCEALRSANPTLEVHEQSCTLSARPSIHMVQLHLISIFVGGVVMSSWVWTESTLSTWKRFFRRLLRQPVNEPVKLKKHEMIAKAFAKRQDLHNGHMSVSFYSSHGDPLGMNLDLNSIASQEISSNWAANIPKFLSRRGGFTGASGLGLRRNSSASDDLSTRPGSYIMGSRRHSLDSQISVQFISEQERLAYLAHARQKRRLKKRELRRRGHNRIIIPGTMTRRGSDSSQQSLPEKKPCNTDKSQRPNSAFTGRPPLSELPILAPIRRNSATSNKAAEDLLRMGTSSGEESSVALPGQLDFGDLNVNKCLKRDSSLDRNIKNNLVNGQLTDNESVASNYGDQLSDAIIDAVWGSRSNLNFSLQGHVNPEVAIELETVRPICSRLSQTSKKSRLTTPLNNLRQFPLLSRTALDIDGDSDIRETSSS